MISMWKMSTGEEKKDVQKLLQERENEEYIEAKLSIKSEQLEVCAMSHRSLNATNRFPYCIFVSADSFIYWTSLCQARMPGIKWRVSHDHIVGIGFCCVNFVGFTQSSLTYSISMEIHAPSFISHISIKRNQVSRGPGFKIIYSFTASIWSF